MLDGCKNPSQSPETGAARKGESALSTKTSVEGEIVSLQSFEILAAVEEAAAGPGHVALWRGDAKDRLLAALAGAGPVHFVRVRRDQPGLAPVAAADAGLEFGVQFGLDLCGDVWLRVIERPLHLYVSKADFRRIGERRWSGFIRDLAASSHCGHWHVVSLGVTLRGEASCTIEALGHAPETHVLPDGPIKAAPVEAAP